MTPFDDSNEFHRANELTFRMTITPDQAMMMREWAASVPTLHFLDICAASVTKISKAALEKDARKAKLADVLRGVDRPHHSVSYLFALMEKVSDSRGVLSDEVLEAQILGDLDALRHFFKQASICESDEFAIGYLRDLRTAPPELGQP